MSNEYPLNRSLRKKTRFITLVNSISLARSEFREGLIPTHNQSRHVKSRQYFTWDTYEYFHLSSSS